MEKHQRIFQAVPLPAVVLGQDGGLEDANEAFQALCPFPEDVDLLMGRLAPDLGRFRSGTAPTETLERKLTLGGQGTRVFRIRLSRAVMEDTSLQVVVLLTDITERRRQLEEITRLGAIVDSSDDAIFSVSFDRKVTSWNAGAEGIYGYAADQMLGGTVMRVIPASVAVGFDAMLAAAARGESFPRHETIHQNEQGNLFPVSLTLSPLRQFDEIVGVTLVCRDISSRRQTEDELKSSHRRLKSLMYETVESLSTAHEKRDLYTAGHQQNVSMLGCCLADEMNLPHDRIEALRIAGLLHDIGKVCIPMAILAKPARLVPEEFALMKRHSRAGYEIVRNIPFPWPVKDIILQHHERLDGSGYPAGLRGQDILLEARILAVADVLEAMSSHRPYRTALGLEAAKKEILEGQGLRFDPEVCRAAFRMMETGTIRMEKGRLVCSL